MYALVRSWNITFSVRNLREICYIGIFWYIYYILHITFVYNAIHICWLSDNSVCIGYYTLCAWCAATPVLSTCKYSYIARQTFMLNGGNIKWSKGKILQRALVRVIYTSEKLHDVYDSYSRIIYSVWPWQGKLREIYFSSFSWRDRRLSDEVDIVGMFSLKHWVIFA